MAPTLLYPLYLGVMGAAAFCFVTAYRRRYVTSRHMRWALTGLALDLTGTVVVLVFYRVLGWSIPAAFPVVVFWHRRCAYVATALLLLVALSGWRRWRVHPTLGRILLPLYLVTLGLAIVGFWPY